MTAKEIKQIVSIEQVLSCMYGLEVKNRMDCPIHGGDNCFSVKKNENGDDFFKCFSCGASGDIFNLVQKMSSIDFIEAKNLICNYFNLVPIYSKEEREAHSVHLKCTKQKQAEKQILQKLRRYQQDRICQVLREIRTAECNSLLEKHLENLLTKFEKRAEFFITHDIHAHLKSVLYRHLVNVKSQDG